MQSEANAAKSARERARIQAMTTEQLAAYRAAARDRKAEARAAGTIKSKTGLQQKCPNPACQFMRSASNFAAAMRLHVKVKSECREWIVEKGDFKQRKYLRDTSEDQEAGAPER